MAQAQSKKLQALRAHRNNEEVRRRLDALKHAAAQEPVVRKLANSGDQQPFSLSMNLSFARCQLRLRNAPFPLAPTLSPGEREDRVLFLK